MNKPVKLAPSIFAADLCRLKQQIEELEANRVELLHVDVMDGHFVERMAFGADHIKIKRVRAMIGSRSVDLEVDGSIDGSTIRVCRDAGANVFVSGGYLFAGNITENIGKLRKACK